MRVVDTHCMLTYCLKCDKIKKRWYIYAFAPCFRKQLAQI